MLLRSTFTALVVLSATFTTSPVAAQVQRTFPQTALRGALVVGEPPEITLNGRPARLAPGARIRNQANMLQMSGSLTGVRLLVPELELAARAKTSSPDGASGARPEPCL